MTYSPTYFRYGAISSALHLIIIITIIFETKFLTECGACWLARPDGRQTPEFLLFLPPQHWNYTCVLPSVAPSFVFSPDAFPEFRTSPQFPPSTDRPLVRLCSSWSPFGLICFPALTTFAGVKFSVTFALNQSIVSWIVSWLPCSFVPIINSLLATKVAFKIYQLISYCSRMRCNLEIARYKGNSSRLIFPALRPPSPHVLSSPSLLGPRREPLASACFMSSAQPWSLTKASSSCLNCCFQFHLSWLCLSQGSRLNLLMSSVED